MSLILQYSNLNQFSNRPGLDRITWGDIYQIACPRCKHEIYDLWDLGLPLTRGATIPCIFCGADLLIVEANGFQIGVQSRA